jgi:glycosyltransferase involved in cell wall biosynthesis
MTVYNGMPFLRPAVESVLAQSLRDFRFVIVNDGSTDGTEAYLLQLADPRVLVLHQHNQGTATAANNGLAHCEGEYVARMDSDDIALPQRLHEQVAYLDAHQDVGLVGTQVAPLGSVRSGRSLRLPTVHEAIDAALVAGRHGLAHSSIMMRRELLKSIGGYWSLPLVDDWDMMLRMAEVGRLANIDEVLHLYRVHAGSLNGSGLRKMRLSIDFARELAKRRRGGLSPISLADFQRQRDARPVWERGWDRLHTYALAQYRVAVAEQCGGRPIRGGLRLAWAAACAPDLTAERIVRVIHNLDGRSKQQELAMGSDIR